MPIKIAISGVGNRALPKDVAGSNWMGWFEQIKNSPHFGLVAAHDPLEESLSRCVDRNYLSKDKTFTSLVEMLAQVSADALLITNPATFHGKTIELALQKGLHVLVEKPFVTDLNEGKNLIIKLKENKLVCSVIQNWRTKSVGSLLFEKISKNELGKIGHVFFRYVRNRENPNYPDYIFKEKYPLLYAMGIHHLDLLRYVLQDEFISIRGEAFKPPWSLYESETGHQLTLKTKKGSFVTYTGTFSSLSTGLTQESLVIEGEKGTLVTESDWGDPPPTLLP